MISNKRVVNYKFIDGVQIYNSFDVNVRGHLKIKKQISKYVNFKRIFKPLNDLR
jgi:hypothetical protein